MTNEFGEPEEEQEDDLVTLASGATYDRSKGRIVGNSGRGMYAFTSVTGAAAARRRWEIHRQAFVDGFVEGAGGDGREGSEFAWRLVGKRVAALILSGENSNPRGQAEIIRLAAELLGNVPNKADATERRGVAVMDTRPGMDAALFRLITGKLIRAGANLENVTDAEYTQALLEMTDEMDEQMQDGAATITSPPR